MLVPEFEETDEEVAVVNPFKRSSRVSHSPIRGRMAEPPIYSPMQPRLPLPLPKERRSFRKALQNSVLDTEKSVDDSKKRQRVMESPDEKTEKKKRTVPQKGDPSPIPVAAQTQLAAPTPAETENFWELFQQILKKAKDLSLLKMESEEVRLVTSELLDLVNKADMVKKNVTSVSSSKKKREEEIRKQVEAAGQSGEVEEVLKKFWPEATFKQTELIKEDYQSQLNGKVEKLAIVVDKEKPIEDSHLPQLREAIKTAKRGQVFITKTQAAIDGDEDEPTTTSSSTLLTVIVDSDKENWFKDLQRGLKTTEKMSCNNFTTSSVKVAKTLRKMLELEAVKSNRKYKIFCLPRSTVKIEGPQHQTSEIWPTIKNTKKAPSLIIKTGEGQSFADTLKKVKETVTNTHGVTVKNIENKNGDVKINLRTFNKEKVENFRKEIEHQVGARTEKLELMKTLIIRDLDESTEPVEILRAIQNETNYTLKEQIRLSKNVNQRSGMKYATTRVPDNIAKLLIAKRKIRVGLGHMPCGGILHPSEMFSMFQVWSPGKGLPSRK